MTRDEVKQIFKRIMVAYPNYKPNDLSETVNMWSEMLKNDPYEDVLHKLDNYIAENKFAPTIADLKVRKKSFSNLTNECTVHLFGRR